MEKAVNAQTRIQPETLSQHPLDISLMSEDELNAKLEKSYQEMLDGKGIPEEDAVAEFKRKYGI